MRQRATEGATEEIHPSRALANWKELAKKALACIFTFPALLWRLVTPSSPRMLAQPAQRRPAQAAMTKVNDKDLESLSRTAATMAHHKGLQDTQENQLEEFMKYKMAEQGKPYGGHSGAKESSSRSSWEASGISSSRNEMRKSCTHSKTTRIGSNPFVTILTCKLCSLELSRTRTQTGIEYDEKKVQEKEIKSGIINEEEKYKKPPPLHRTKYGMTSSEHSDWTEQFNRWHSHYADTLNKEEWKPATDPAPKQKRSRAQPRCGTARSDND